MTNVPFRVLLSEGPELSLVAVDATRHLAATNTTKQWGEKLQSFSVGIHVYSLILNWVEPLTLSPVSIYIKTRLRIRVSI